MVENWAASGQGSLNIERCVQPSKMELVLGLPDENFSHVILGPEVDECLGHLLKLMVEDFDLSLSENKNENLKNILKN